MGFEANSAKTQHSSGVASGFGFPDFSASSASELLGLMGEADSVRRRADDGMGRIERQRARRSLKVFDGSGGMVVLHAELDQVAGDRVKTAIGGEQV